MLSFFRGRRRDRLKKQPFPAAWSEILDRNTPWFADLSPEQQAKLRGDIQIFVAEKSFEGCGGQAIDDEVKVTIAAHACLLLLGRETEFYPELVTILVYPSAYRVPTPQHAEGGIVIEGGQARLGESWDRGMVVLAWDAVLHGAREAHDGHNVALHEFAHQLDQEDGDADGAPVLSRRGAYGEWARVLGTEYLQLQRDADKQRRTVLDTYGATNPAEFFAVATEVFFERPAALRKRHPELYDELAHYYRRDPLAKGDP